jgi:thymidine kinase
MLTNSFTMYVGPMFSGKTTRLLFDVDRAKFRKQRVALFKPKKDDRYSSVSIVSHAGLMHDAVSVDTGTGLMSVLLGDPNDIDIICVDEAFMIRGVADALKYMYSLGKTIIVSSLDLSYACIPFGEISEMLPYATNVVKCAAVCTNCGADAFYTHRTVQSDEDILIGGSELYDAVCRNHHPVMSDTNNWKEN